MCPRHFFPVVYLLSHSARLESVMFLVQVMVLDFTSQSTFRTCRSCCFFRRLQEAKKVEIHLKRKATWKRAVLTGQGAGTGPTSHRSLLQKKQQSPFLGLLLHKEDHSETLQSRIYFMLFATCLNTFYMAYMLILCIFSFCPKPVASLPASLPSLLHQSGQLETQNSTNSSLSHHSG